MTPDRPLPHIYFMDALKFVRQHSWISGAAATLLLLTHFSKIGYLPALSLADFGLVGAAILAFTVITACLFVTVYLLPGACYEAWGSARLIPRQELPKKGARYQRLNSRKGDPGADSSNPGSTSTPSRKFSMLAVLGISYAGFFLAVISLASTMLAPDSMRDNLFVAFFLVCFGLSAAVAAQSRGKFTRGVRKSRFDWRLRLLLFTWLLYGAAIPFALIMLSVLPSADVFKVQPMGVVALLALPLAHFCFYSTSRLPNPVRANALIFVGIYIVVSLGVASAAIDTAASRLRVGMMNNQTVILTVRGCSALMAARITENCAVVPGESTLRSAGPVDILTRLGSHVVISQPGWSHKGKKISAPIKASEVDTWFPAPELEEPNESAQTQN